LFSSRSPCVSLVRRCASFSTIPRYFSWRSSGIVPSSMASMYPLIDVRGERKSWDILDINDFRYSFERLSSSAISSMYLASSPNSLLAVTFTRALKFPCAYDFEVLMISRIGFNRLLDMSINAIMAISMRIRNGTNVVESIRVWISCLNVIGDASMIVPT